MVLSKHDYFGYFLSKIAIKLLFIYAKNCKQINKKIFQEKNWNIFLITIQHCQKCYITFTNDLS